MFPIFSFSRNYSFPKIEIAKLLLVFLFLGFSEALLAQNPQKEPPKKERKPWVMPKFSLDAVRFGADLTMWGAGLMIKDYAFLGSYYNNTRKIAFTVDVATFDNRLFFLGEWGYSDVLRNLISVQSVSPNRGGFSYNNWGTYWRMGLDYNVLWKNFKKDAILVGINYGVATFKDSLFYNQVSTPWDFVNIPNVRVNRYERLIYNENNAPVHWFEITTGLRVSIWRNIQLGYTFRYKFLLSDKLGSEELVSNEAPGYGTTEKRRKVAFSYHIYYRIPLRKKEKPK